MSSFCLTCGRTGADQCAACEERLESFAEALGRNQPSLTGGVTPLAAALANTLRSFLPAGVFVETGTSPAHLATMLADAACIKLGVQLGFLAPEEDVFYMAEQAHERGLRPRAACGLCGQPVRRPGRDVCAACEQADAAARAGLRAV